MRSLTAGVLFLLAALVAVVGLGMGVQLRAPWWQIAIALALVLGVCFGLVRAGRAVWRRR